MGRRGLGLSGRVCVACMIPLMAHSTHAHVPLHSSPPPHRTPYFSSVHTHVSTTYVHANSTHAPAPSSPLMLMHTHTHTMPGGGYHDSDHHRSERDCAAGGGDQAKAGAPLLGQPAFLYGGNGRGSGGGGGAYKTGLFGAAPMASPHSPHMAAPPSPSAYNHLAQYAPQNAGQS